MAGEGDDRLDVAIELALEDIVPLCSPLKRALVLLLDGSALEVGEPGHSNGHIMD